MSRSQSNNSIMAPTPPSLARQRSLWHNRDFMILWSGQLISTFGSRMSIFAMPLLLVALTHSLALTGLISALAAVPSIVLSLPAGALVDRWNRKWVMIVVDSGRAIAMGSIPVAAVLGHLTVLHVTLAIIMEGTLAPFFTIAQSASLPRIVEREQLSQAVAQNQTIVASSQLLAPALGGLSYALNQTFPFLADSISYSISALSLCLIKRPLQSNTQGSRRNLKSEITEGFLWIWHHPILRPLILLHWGLLTPVAGWILLYEQLAQHLHATPWITGLIIACCGLGSMIGSLLAGPLLKRFRPGQILFVTVWLWVLLWLPLAMSPNPLWFGIVNITTFTISSIYFVAQSSYQLSLIPDHLQGRVKSVTLLLITASQPLGLVLMGLLIQLSGPVATALFLFIPQLLLAGIVTLFYRHLFALTKENKDTSF